MFKTINSKFIFFTITFILIIVGTPIGFLVIQFRENFEQRSRIMVESTMDVVNRSITNAMMSGEQKQVQTIVENISHNEGVDHLRIFSENGKILFSSEVPEVGINIEELSPGHINFSTLDESIISLLEDERVYSAVRPIMNQQKCQGCHEEKPVIAYLDVDTNLTQAERYFYTGSIHMIFLGLAIILALFLGFYILFRTFINKPLIRFRTALASVERGNLDVNLPANKDDEIGKLEKHFNHMVEKLKDSKEQQPLSWFMFPPTCSKSHNFIVAPMTEYP
jgi:methyl-accepting chemotaxis protein